MRAALEARLRLETVTTQNGLDALAGEWDELVRAMPRPSPFLLHAWISEWWRRYGDGADLAVHVARRDGALVGAVPLFTRRRSGLRTTEFVGSDGSALADMLLADPHDAEVARALADRVREGDHDLLDLFGLPGESRLAPRLGPALRLLERVEAPVLDLSPGWPAVYQEKTDSKKRNLHKRRRRQLGKLGRVEVVHARTIDDLEPALEDAFVLHELRWSGRPDGSGFATPTGKEFHRAALRALAELDVARIVTLKLDGRPIAFHYFFALCKRMYVHRLAFDPTLARLSPGVVNTLDALEAASDEGLELVEYLGGGERYKLELADRTEPLYHGLGVATSLRGHAVVASRLAAIRLRRQLKQSPRLRRLYFEGLAPVRRLRTKLT